MSEKIIVGPVGGGLVKNRIPTYINNDSFPVLVNAYQWRGRIKRKRGTSLLGRLRRFISSTISSYSTTASTITLDANGEGNLLTGFGLDSNGNIQPGTVTITQGGTDYVDTAMDGTLAPSGSINYGTGNITILAEANNAVSAVFWYYPVLPVLGLDEFKIPSNQFATPIAFDNKYSYQITATYPYRAFDVSFYKNPAEGAPLTNYVRKTNYTPTTWNGFDYQQFYTVTFQGAFWATNGLNNPFDPTKYSMQYSISSDITYVSNTATTLVVNIAGNVLVVGDFVFVNEWTASVTDAEKTLNFQTGYVTIIAGANITITFPNANLNTAGTYTPGIIQYLTNRSDETKDCIRFYDGDPTSGSITAPTLTGLKGWVNFCPPLSQFDMTIADLPADQYYLVGAKIIFSFKDRLLFIGPIVQTSAAGSQKYLADTIVYSQNGTVYYTSSFTLTAGQTITGANVDFNPILVPDDQTATAPAWFGDSTGFGGFITAGIDQAINTCENNEDVLIIGFEQTQARCVYTGNDIIPFTFYLINSELGSSSTFSAINMDEGVLAVGSRGFTMSNQNQTARFDLDIPDEVFEFNLQNNGAERFTAERDYANEWMYFTYKANNYTPKFPNTTLQYNYRDKTWATFTESYTHYGTFAKRTGLTWATVGETYPTWSEWNDPWNASTSTVFQPEVIAGNQQGYILFREDGTGEGVSLSIRSITGNTIEVINHNLVQGEYFTISGAIGDVAAQINGKIFSVSNVVDEDNFTLNPPITTATYLGLGQIKRMYVPFIQTKQFPVAWGDGRKTRLGPQQYLLSATARSQVTLYIYLSQDADNPYNQGPVVPFNAINDALIYDSVLYTCVESSNLGLTPFNTNLQMISEINEAGDNASSPQSRIWHRVNTSLLGDTIQLAITLSDAQMRDADFTNQFAEIELHGFILDVSPSGYLA